MVPRRIALAVCTYRRPEDLGALLPMLAEQAESSPHSVRVVVVDNDPAGRAAVVCDAAGLPSVAYEHEPRPGIAAARNRVLDVTNGRDDVVVFVDDDERPHPGWLDALVETFTRFEATGVVGPVVSVFEGEIDPWIDAGRFFTRRRLDTGTLVDVAATNNLLLDRHFVRDAGIRFDERFGLSGGSDTLFSREVVRSGGRLVWCAEAVVTDVVPVARATRSWVLRRHLRSGNTDSRVSLELAASPLARSAARLTQVARGGARVAAGVARACVGLAGRDLHHQANGARNIARGAGMISGALGHVYVEYRRPTRVA